MNGVNTPLSTLGMCGNPKVGLEWVLEKTEPYRFQKVKTESQFSMTFYETEKKAFFLNVVCLLTEVQINCDFSRQVIQIIDVRLRSRNY